MFESSIVFKGHVANDLEKKFTPNGTGVVNFRVLNGKKSDEKKRVATGFTIVCVGKLAEKAMDIKIGTKVCVYGYPRTRWWFKRVDGEGSDIKMYRTEIVAEKIEYIRDGVELTIIAEKRV